jgi:hypothetical protein
MEAKLRNKRVYNIIRNDTLNLVYHLTGLRIKRQGFFKSVRSIL